MILLAGIDSPIEFFGAAMLGIFIAGVVLALIELLWSSRNPINQGVRAKRELQEQREIAEAERRVVALRKHADIILFDKKKQTWSAFYFPRRRDRIVYRIFGPLLGPDRLRRAVHKALREQTD